MTRKSSDSNSGGCLIALFTLTFSFIFLVYKYLLYVPIKYLIKFIIREINKSRAKNINVEEIAKKYSDSDTSKNYTNNYITENSKRIHKGKSLIKSVDDYTIIDIETTGLSPRENEIIELGAIKIRNNKIVAKYNTLLKPTNEIPKHITRITNITNEMVSNAPGIENKLEEFINFIGNDIIVGHNVNFDINFLYDNSIRILNKPLENNFVDTLRLSRMLIGDTPNHKLETLSKKFNIDNTDEHRAYADIVITFNLYNILKTKMTEDTKSNNENTQFLFQNEEDVLNKIIKDLDMKDCKIVSKTTNYTTLVYKDYDLIRIKYTDNTKWISIFLTKEDRKNNIDSPLFKTQKNKNQLFWKSFIEDEIDVYYPFIKKIYTERKNGAIEIL